VGIYFVFVRFFTDATQRKKTVYGLTNERIIIISGLWNSKVNSLNLKLSQIFCKRKSDRSGSIMLGPPNPYGGFQGFSCPERKVFGPKFLI